MPAAVPVVLLSQSGALGLRIPTTCGAAWTGRRAEAQLVVIQMDTPGGLDLSMRTFIKNILRFAVITADMPQLLKQLDGRKLSVLGQEKRLATAAAEIIDIQPDWRTRLLAVITDPGIAYILLMIGFYGLLFEFYSPGLVAPGVIGGISLLLALFALQCCRSATPAWR